MSLGGLVAYGDSDNSDEEISDTEENLVSSKSVSKSDNIKAIAEQPVARQPNVAEAKVLHEEKPVSDFGVGSTVDDIEDDDPINISQTPFNALKLPPPKHGSDGNNSDFFGSLPRKTPAENTPISTSVNILDETNDPGDTATLLLAGLPTPKPDSSTPLPQADEEDEIEEDIKQKTLQLKTKAEAPPKRTKRQPVKITIPDLPQYDSDEEETPSKKRKKSEAGTGKSGLFSLLPSPKNVSIKTTNRPLLPYTLTKKPAAPVPPKPKPKQAAPLVSAPKPLVVGVPDDDSDEDADDTPSSSANFFSIGQTAQTLRPSLNTAPEIEEPIKPEPVLTGPWQQNTEISGASSVDLTTNRLTTTQMGEVAGPSFPPTDMANSEMATATNLPYSSVEYTNYAGQQEEPSEVQQFLQDEEFLKLAGRRQRGRETIDFIDVQADHNITKEELTKHITEEVSGYSYSKKGKDMPSTQQRRKHQITYLAHQAKEREMELKNQWANNRVTKRQTQAKYGF